MISEWLDVDEVEEAFAKMRRAAGVRIPNLHFSHNQLDRVVFPPSKDRKINRAGVSPTFLSMGVSRRICIDSPNLVVYTLNV